VRDRERERERETPAAQSTHMHTLARVPTYSQGGPNKAFASVYVYVYMYVRACMHPCVCMQV
jgi:hypothetical protein